MQLNSHELDTSKLEQLTKYASIHELAESGLLGESAAQIYRNSDGLTRRKFIAGLSALVYALAEEACSEKNGNNPGPGPSPVPTGAIATGRLVGVNNPNQGYNSGIADFSNKIGNITDGGNYRVENVSPIVMNSTFTGNDFITRVVKVNVQNGHNQFQPIDAIDKVIDGIEFDLQWFDEVCRAGIAPSLNQGVRDGTRIWNYVPEIVVDAESRNKMEFPGVYPGMLRDIRRYPTEFMPKLSDNKLVGAPVIEIQRTVDVPKAPAEGKIIIRFGTRYAAPPEGADGGAGVANFWINTNNNIYAAEVVLTSDISGAGIYHELTHAIGFVSHPSRDGQYTIISKHPGFEPTPWDFAHGKVLYRIKPGSRTPYDTSHLETLTGTVSLEASNKYINLLKNLGLLPRNLRNAALREYRA